MTNGWLVQIDCGGENFWLGKNKEVWWKFEKKDHASIFPNHQSADQAIREYEAIPGDYRRRKFTFKIIYATNKL